MREIIDTILIINVALNCLVLMTLFLLYYRLRRLIKSGGLNGLTRAMAIREAGLLASWLWAVVIGLGGLFFVPDIPDDLVVFGATSVLTRSIALVFVAYAQINFLIRLSRWHDD